MLENISKEIFYYSFIPVFVITILILILLLVGKKKNNNYFKYNYFIKVLLAILIGFVLSIMTGYTIWVFLRVINLEILKENILYLLVLSIIVISLLSTLIIMVYKLYKSYDEKEKELQK